MVHVQGEHFTDSGPSSPAQAGSPDQTGRCRGRYREAHRGGSQLWNKTADFWVDKVPA